jgi:hypothetical protein
MQLPVSDAAILARLGVNATTGFRRLGFWIYFACCFLNPAFFFKASETGSWFRLHATTNGDVENG